MVVGLLYCLMRFLMLVDEAFDGTDDVFEHAGISTVVSEFPA
jgi:hypothetical protein